MIKKKMRIVIACVVILAIGSGILLVPNISKADEEKQEVIEGYVQRGNLESTSSASGTTAAGTDYEYLDIDMNFDTLLEVEKVYVETGTEVATQSAILKVTKSSYDTTKANLERALRQAKTALQEAKITYKTDVLTLKSKYISNVCIGEIAEESYENNLEILDLQAEQAKEEYEEAKSIISQNPSKITKKENEINKKEKQISKLKKQQKNATDKEENASKEYEEAKAVYEQATKQKEEIETVKNYINSYQGVENPEESKEDKEPKESVSSNIKSEEDEGKESLDSGVQALIEKVNSDVKERETAYQIAEKNYYAKQETLTKWQQIVEKKETAMETKEQEITTLEQTIEKEKEELANAKKQVNSLQISYEQAVSNQESQCITEKKELEENRLTSQGAAVSYELELAELEEVLEEAKETYQDAKNTLNIFEEGFQDYTWYSKESGTLNYLGYEEGDYITNRTPILGYYNGNTISLEITIDQSEIAALSVGDEVTVVTSSMPRGTIGVISGISNTKNSTSASKVTYGVTVSCDNTQGNIQSGETATVTFQANTLENVLYIAQRLVQNDERGNYVTIKESTGETKEVKITTGLETGTFVEIKDGLKEGDCCVIIKSKEAHKNVE